MSKKPAANMFEHNGVAIIVSTQGNFCAIVNGIEVRKPSIDAMRKHIDKAKPFEPFKAIRVLRYRATVETLKIVGTKPQKTRFQRVPVAWLDDRGGTHDKVLRDTPANRAKLDTYLKERADILKQEAALNERMGELEKTIEGELATQSEGAQ